MSEMREAALQLCQALDTLNIPYAFGGSYASSVHGIARATQGLDIVAAITLAQAGPLADLLHPSFYAEPGQIRGAILHRRAFNVIHLASALKLDVFPASSHPLGAQQINRRQFTETTLMGGSAATFPVISAEDILLAKLRWFKDGGGTSERQWNDLRNILRIQGNRLDRAYLNEWAATLEVSDLLETLLHEV